MFRLCGRSCVNRVDWQQVTVLTAHNDATAEQFLTGSRWSLSNEFVEEPVVLRWNIHWVSFGRLKCHPCLMVEITMMTDGVRIVQIRSHIRKDMPYAGMQTKYLLKVQNPWQKQWLSPICKLSSSKLQNVKDLLSKFCIYTKFYVKVMQKLINNRHVRGMHRNWTLGLWK